jgi:hypothetical protein
MSWKHRLMANLNTEEMDHALILPWLVAQPLV